MRWPLRLRSLIPRAPEQAPRVEAGMTSGAMNSRRDSLDRSPVHGNAVLKSKIHKSNTHTYTYIQYRHTQTDKHTHTHTYNSNRTHAYTSAHTAIHVHAKIRNAKLEKNPTVKFLN